ncbi:hypothetical protein [Saccharothrix syringae]|uniref:Uncharacterized protein n=1 Tax=Saccharothrix syringae TaxID=103733 RepID=A0A5Q0H9R2_SACSY|nr:hypothetical protein [Saccharothrix syringae]QFZ22978.1 hypothetical protein EKG83_41055 [Saccharothrix syringae]
MVVNGSDEPTALRARLAAHLARPVDPADDAAMRSRAAVADVLVEGRAAAAVERLRRELRGYHPPPAARDHLAVALAARSAEVRAVDEDGALVVVDRAGLAECRAIAREILDLRPAPDLVDFAHDLLDRLDRAERWRWVAPDSVPGAAVVALAVLVLPFVGGAVGSAAVTAGGVAVGAALVFGATLAHRRRQWAVDAARPLRRPGR